MLEEQLSGDDDMDILDQIIKLAESAMIKPFSKKKEGEDPLEANGEESETLEASPDEEIPEGNDDEMSDEDLDELMESYKRG